MKGFLIIYDVDNHAVLFTLVKCSVEGTGNEKTVRKIDDTFLHVDLLFDFPFFFFTIKNPRVEEMNGRSFLAPPSLVLCVLLRSNP